MENADSKKTKSAAAEGGAGLMGDALIAPAPSSAVFRQYMAQQPALATGAVSLDIPLYTIDFRGFRLPLSLKYLSNGVKVFDSPYPCGYGWSLHPGLRISRTVMGRPDELFPQAGVWGSSNPHFYEGTEYDFCRRLMHAGGRAL